MIPIYCAGGPFSSPRILLNSAQTGLDAIFCCLNRDHTEKTEPAACGPHPTKLAALPAAL
jgi:hypothetical protein